MNGLFSMDGPFFRFGNMLADIMLLSFIWLLFSIPLITIGASTTALFYVTTRRISDKEGYLFRDFVSSFKANFKQATLTWLLLSALVGLVVTNLFLLQNEAFNSDFAVILYPLQMIILIELFITSIYIFPLIARFEMSFLQTIKTAFFMANRHLLTTASCVAVAIAVFLLTLIFAPLVFIAIGVYAYATSYMVMTLFKKYRPEIDSENYAAEPLAPIKDIREEKEESDGV